MVRSSVAWSLAVLPLAIVAYFTDLPATFNGTPARWACVSYGDHSVAVLPGSFNRSAMDALYKGYATDPELEKRNAFLNTTNFIAYDERFMDILGPKAAITQVQKLASQSHEAPCFNKDTNELFFVERVTTNPPTINAPGCVYHKGADHVVTDGRHNQNGALVRIDPATLKKTVLLNSYYEQPFGGLNDLEIDAYGNFWFTDSKSGWGRDLTDTTMRLRVVHITTGNANGVAVSPLQDGRHVLYLPDTGVSEAKPVDRKNPYGNRALFAYDVAAGGVLTNARFLNNPISYFYDGIRVSRNGWIFVGAGDGVDVTDPVSGPTLGTIRVGGGSNLAVNMAFGENQLWILSDF
ncbi:AkeP protein [Colletotrichum salicis]|uniref:AkeP protein n=1 Tax=Colletotrichum salicis TaxID=1209931 RepID=A0A135S0J0_9PEZI|nr:AkeP protein [Colletotrichum salicis]